MSTLLQEFEAQRAVQGAEQDAVNPAAAARLAEIQAAGARR